MSAISTILTQLRTASSHVGSAILAITVRDKISEGLAKAADAIEQCYSDVNNPTLQTEALEAAVQAKIDEGEMAALTIADGSITREKLDPDISFDTMTATVEDETIILEITSGE